MSDGVSPGNLADIRRDPHEGDKAGSSGVSISAQGNIELRESVIAGRYINKTTIIKNRTVRLRLGLGGLALLIASGIGITLANSSSPGGVVYKAGVQGAVGTLRQLQQAEEQGNASSWCFLASSADSGTCQSLLSNGYSTSASASIRSQVPEITIGNPSGRGDAYTFTLTYKGRAYPGVSLEWTGQRWQLSPVFYDASLNNDGLFASVIEAATGRGALFGIPFG